MLVMSSHAPSIMMQNEGHAPPKLHCIQQSGWNEGSLSRSMKDSTCILQDLNKITRFGKGVVSFFVEVDILKELSSQPLFHFLTSLTQDQELCSTRPSLIF